MASTDERGRQSAVSDRLNSSEFVSIHFFSCSKKSKERRFIYKTRLSPSRTHRLCRYRFASQNSLRLSRSNAFHVEPSTLTQFVILGNRQLNEFGNDHKLQSSLSVSFESDTNARRANSCTPDPDDTIFKPPLSEDARRSVSKDGRLGQIKHSQRFEGYVARAAV
jgi:hypothetical protein